MPYRGGDAKVTKCPIDSKTLRNRSKKTVQYLGFMINKNGITTTQENIEKVKNYPIPRTVKEARNNLGLIIFYRKHIASFSNYAVKISDLTKKKTGPFVWTDEAF